MRHSTSFHSVPSFETPTEDEMAAPVLSTPAEYGRYEPVSAAVLSSESQLSEEQLYVQYEIKRTVDEIRHGKWTKIALQFPDEMLVHAPRVFERLQDDLKAATQQQRTMNSTVDQTIATGLSQVRIANNSVDAHGSLNDTVGPEDDVESKLCILGDTSYGACCVDEVAAEHTDAQVVVHYGRSCLSPTARLPVIYVFTSKPLDLDAVVASFKTLYPDHNEKVCLMADIPYHHHVPVLAERMHDDGYLNVFATKILHDPASLLPNRTTPLEVAEDPDRLKAYAIFHISTPPTSLLLVLSSRVKSIHICSGDAGSSAVMESSSAAILRRRYGLITRLSTVPVFGILINTLSVSNYLTALAHCQELIAAAGKKSYVFVVGKVNAAKVANFSEIGGWVVIGCWESSLIESKDFYRPIITPFELELALQSDEVRLWNGEWVADFATLLRREKKDTTILGERKVNAQSGKDDEVDAVNGVSETSWEDQASDDEPPEFDLRAGRYVSNSRPMRRSKPSANASFENSGDPLQSAVASPISSALVRRANGDVATVNGAVSPAAEFLRSQRTWTGLGSDVKVAYERDDGGNIRGARVEEGRAGVARGYRVGTDDQARS